MHKFSQFIPSTIKRFYRNAKLRRNHFRWHEIDHIRARFYGELLQPNEVCFDIGANFGNRVKIFSKLGAKVIAVEPQSDCIHFLQSIYKTDPMVNVIQAAVGMQTSMGILYVSSENTLSTLSEDWIIATKQSGRFQNYEIVDKISVPIITLDSLIEKYGSPKFIKIDVEGYEYPVIAGLSNKVACVSLEFAAEFIEPICQCIDHLHKLGARKANYVIDENATFELTNWMDIDVAKGHMIKVCAEGLERNTKTWGDLYIS